MGDVGAHGDGDALLGEFGLSHDGSCGVASVKGVVAPTVHGCLRGRAAPGVGRRGVVAADRVFGCGSEGGVTSVGLQDDGHCGREVTRPLRRDNRIGGGSSVDLSSNESCAKLIRVCTRRAHVDPVAVSHLLSDGVSGVRRVRLIVAPLVGEFVHGNDLLRARVVPPLGPLHHAESRGRGRAFGPEPGLELSVFVVGAPLRVAGEFLPCSGDSVCELCCRRKSQPESVLDLVLDSRMDVACQ
ncbi:hypothetical protein ACQ86D_52045 (plasmid) [Streptomyces galilaeus]